MKPAQSIIVRKIQSNAHAAYQYPVNPFRRTVINLYFRHVKAKEGRPVMSIRRNAFEVSVTIPKFSPYNVNYTRPSNYY